MTANPLTGNIYSDDFWDEGHHYRDYTIDCAKCGKARSLKLSREHPRTVGAAMNIGWGLGKKGKWLCPDCLAGEYA